MKNIDKEYNNNCVILFVCLFVFFLSRSSSGGTLKDFNGEVASQAQTKAKDKVSR